MASNVVPIRPETLAAVQESDDIDRLVETELRESAEVCRERGFHVVRLATIGFCETCSGGVARDQCNHSFGEVRLCRRCGEPEGSTS